MQPEHGLGPQTGSRNVAREGLPSDASAKTRSVVYDWIVLIVVMSAIYGMGYWIAH